MNYPAGNRILKETERGKSALKICFISPYPPERDGVADYSYYLIKSIGKLTKECSFVVMARTLDGRLVSKQIGEKVILLRIWGMGSLAETARSLVVLIRAIATSKPDIIHIQYRFTRDQGGSAGEPWFLLMLLAKLLLRAPRLVISLHDFWLPKEAERRAFEITGSRLASRLYRFYYYFYLRAVLRVPDSIVSIVSSENSAITRSLKGLTSRRVLEIPHGLPEVIAPATERPFSVYKSKGEDKRENDAFRILLFGFIRRAKGYHYVIEAVGKLVGQDPSLRRKIKLVIAGIPSPPQERGYLDYLQDLVSKLSLNDCVTIITKFLSEEEISSLFNSADLMVAPYSVRVGPSGVLSFALAYGVPAIVTFDERYFTRDSKIPAFAADLSVAGIASAISKLMTDHVEYGKQVQLIEEYRKKNNNEKIALRHVKLYKDLLSLR